MVLPYLHDCTDWLISPHPFSLQYTSYDYADYEYNEGGVATDIPPTEGAKTEVTPLLI